MRNRIALVLAPSAIALVGLFFACTGDDPSLSTSSDAGAGNDATNEATTVNDGGADTQSSDSSTTDAPVLDAAPDCGAPKDQTPCGCTGAGPQDCCSYEDGGTTCHNAGTPPAMCMSGPTYLIACVGPGSCSPNQACCFGGTLSGSACARKLSHFDTSCNDRDPDAAAPPPCGTQQILCAKDQDCIPDDAGTCVAAVMDTLGRTMGVCVR